MKQKAARQVSLLIILVAALLTEAAPVFAHAIVTRTDPVDGAVLAEAPKQIRLWFSEPVSVDLSKFEVTDGHGQRLTTTVQADNADEALIIIDLPALSPDAYRVAWDALSTDDLHITRGSIVFGVGMAADSAAVAQASAAPQPLEVVIRWADFVALATLIGALALQLLLPAPIDPGRSLIVATEQRLLKLALVAAAAALITSLGGIIVQAIALGSANLSAGEAAWQLLTQTSYGLRWMMREGWTIVLLIIIAWQRRQPQLNRLVLGATLPLLLALAVLQAMNGHAASSTDLSNVGIVATALHLLGAGVWVGGLIALAAAIAPLLRRSFEEAALARTILRRFGLIAAASLSVLFVTGIYNSGQQVASLDALLYTLYGQALLLKIGLVLAVGFIGLMNSAQLHPRVAAPFQRLLRRPIGSPAPRPPRHLGRTVLLEALGATSILLFAALLGSSQPARGPEFDPPSVEAAIKTASGNAADLSVTFSVRPNRPGQNFVTIGAFDTRRPAPAPITHVTVRFTPPNGASEFVRDAELIGNGKYQIAGDAINVAGDWQMTVAVQRHGLADAVWTLPWTVVSPTEAYRHPVQISNQPLAPWLTLAAVLIALIIVGVVGGITLRQRWARTTSQKRESEHDVQALKTG